MAKYEVVNNFYDELDKDSKGDNKHYKIGDVYPNPSNKKVEQARIKELSTAKNKFGIPFIKEVKEETKTESKNTKEKD